MDFIVNKETKTVSITKEFDAELSLVWDAYTNAELLDQWWAPKPFASRTKVMDFEVGGTQVLRDGQPRRRGALIPCINSRRSCRRPILRCSMPLPT